MEGRRKTTRRRECGGCRSYNRPEAFLTSSRGRASLLLVYTVYKTLTHCLCGYKEEGYSRHTVHKTNGARPKDF